MKALQKILNLKNCCLIMTFILLAGLASSCSGTANIEESTDITAEVSPTASMEETPSVVPETNEVPAEPVDDTQKIEEIDTTDIFALPIAETTLTYTMWTGIAPYMTNIINNFSEDIAIIKEISARTNIYLDVTYVSAMAEEEMFGLMIAGGDYTDIIGNMNLYTTGLEGALEDEVIIDLNDLVQQYAPAYYERLSSDVNSLLTMLTDDGQMGALALFYSEKGLENTSYVLHANWLDEFGMSTPETYDEVYEYLLAAKETYGAYMFLAQSGIDPDLLAGYNIAAEEYVVDGEVRHGYNQDEMYDYISMVRKWYAEGLVKEDFYVMFDGTQAYRDMANHVHSLSSFMAIGLSRLPSYADDPSTLLDLKMIGVPTVNKGDEIHSIRYQTIIKNATAWTISTSCTDPVPLIKLCEYLQTDEGIFLYNYGLENEAHTLDENGDPQWTDLIISNPDGYSYSAASYKYASSSASAYLPSVLDLTKDYYNFTNNEWGALETIKEMGDDAYSIPDAVELTTDEYSQYNYYANDVNTYFEECAVAWIIGTKDFNKEVWTSFIEAVNGMGLLEMVKVYQTAYDRYLSEIELYS